MELAVENYTMLGLTMQNIFGWKKICDIADSDLNKIVYTNVLKKLKIIKFRIRKDKCLELNGNYQ